MLFSSVCLLRCALRWYFSATEQHFAQIVGTCLLCPGFLMFSTWAVFQSFAVVVDCVHSQCFCIMQVFASLSSSSLSFFFFCVLCLDAVCTSMSSLAMSARQSTSAVSAFCAFSLLCIRLLSPQHIASFLMSSWRSSSIPFSHLLSSIHHLFSVLALWHAVPTQDIISPISACQTAHAQAGRKGNRYVSSHSA